MMFILVAKFGLNRIWSFVLTIDTTWTPFGCFTIRLEQSFNIELFYTTLNGLGQLTLILYYYHR